MCVAREGSNVGDAIEGASRGEDVREGEGAEGRVAAGAAAVDGEALRVGEALRHEIPACRRRDHTSLRGYVGRGRLLERSGVGKRGECWAGACPVRLGCCWWRRGGGGTYLAPAQTSSISTTPQLPRSRRR